MNDRTTIRIDGMSCSSCAFTVKKSLQKDGLSDVDVDYLNGEATFRNNDSIKLDEAFKNIKGLGYQVVGPEQEHPSDHAHHHDTKGTLSLDRMFAICLIFTIPVVLHMVLPWKILHQPLFQLLLSLPVMIIGWKQFGRSAWGSLKTGAPNMDVLIALGSSAAFVYSIIGMMLYQGSHEVSRYLFFETADTIITLVLLGNLIEYRSVKQTTSAIRELSKLQPDKAKLVTRDHSGAETISEILSSAIHPGDLLLVNSGDRVPTDGKVTWGKAEVDESMVSGESFPVQKDMNSDVIGGTTVVSGSLKIEAIRVGKETFLSKTIALVKDAQKSKPAIQKTGDRISAVFVPVVIVISILTFLISQYAFDKSVEASLLSAIAVLVISCPCAMGLATPTAVMVGLGRAAKKGILIKGGDTLENFANVKTIVFDKTGTLTTGNFKIKKINCIDGGQEYIQTVLYSLEKYSSHPIARSVVREFQELESKAIQWKSVSEDKGVGVNAHDQEGNLYSAGSFQMVKHIQNDNAHNIYLLKNNKLIATVDLSDEVKPGVKEIIQKIHALNIHTVLLSGDKKESCDYVAQMVGIMEVHSEQLPKQKLELIEKFTRTHSTAMVGDGINDAPALARASVGVSLSEATQVAIQSSQVILVPGHDLTQLYQAIHVSRHTLKTIKQNLFWALAYNVVAIPMAAAGFLSPMIGAFSMAFSDVVVIGNSLRLRTKKIF